MSKTRPTLALALATVATSGLATAQSFDHFLPAGEIVLSGDDLLTTVDLPFPVQLPGGSQSPFMGGPTASSLDISTNGRVFAGGTGNTSSAQGINPFVNDPPSIAPLWDDLDSTVRFNIPFPGIVAITWVATEVGGSGTPFTMQLQLWSSFSPLLVSEDFYVFVYDDDLPASNGVVGVSAGNGTAPVFVDYSSPAGVTSSPTAMQHFLGPPGSAVDLQGRALTFRTLEGLPSQWTNVASDPDPLPAYFPGRRSCDQLVDGLTFTPNANGYDIQTTADFDEDYLRGTKIAFQGMGFDVSAPINLPFTFTMPGGSATSSIVVDPSGRISGDPSLAFTLVSTANFLNGPPVICPMWNMSLPLAARTVWFHAESATTVSVTWFVESFGSSSVVQAKLHSDGAIEFAYDTPSDLGLFEINSIVGISEGGGVTGFPTDLSFMQGQQSFGDIAFEQFSATNFFDFNDRLNQDVGIGIGFVEPALGNSIQVGLSPTAGTVAGVLLLGLATDLPGLSSPVSLAVLNIALADCDLYVDIVTPGALFATVGANIGFPTDILPIPNSPILLGFQGLSVQGLLIDPTAPTLITPTDELRISIGG